MALLGGFYFALFAANTDPNWTLVQIAAFVPPLAPMVVPARVVLGDMGALGLAAAVALDVIATAGLILLAARIYERAILQTGARIKLRQHTRRPPPLTRTKVGPDRDPRPRRRAPTPPSLGAWISH